LKNNKKYRLYLASIKSDKEAITLTAASTVLFVEMALTPGENDQGEDRILRIGQKANSVNIYYLLAHDSIDEYIWKMVESKRKIVTQTIDGNKAAEKLNEEIDIEELFKKLKQKRS